MFRKFMFLFDSDPQEEIYGKCFKKYNLLNDLFGLIIMTFIGILIAIIYIYYIFNNQPPTKFYTVNLEDKKISYLHVYDTPILSGNNIINWAENAAKEILTFNFLNYEKKLKNNKIYFSINGYNTFSSFFQESPLLNEVKKNKLEMSLIPIDKPIIIKNFKTFYGKKNWIIEMPVFISYKGANPTLSKKYFLTLTIEEANTDTYQNGLYITSLKLSI